MSTKNKQGRSSHWIGEWVSEWVSKWVSVNKSQQTRNRNKVSQSDKVYTVPRYKSNEIVMED